VNGLLERIMAARTSASVKSTARLTGALYVATLPFGLFGLGYVTSAHIVGPGASRTVEAAARLLRLGIAAGVIGEVLFVIVVLRLYELFAPVNTRQAALMAVLALLSVPMSLLTEVTRLAAIRLLTDTGLGAFTPAQLQAQAAFSLGIYQDGIFMAQFLWGLWLLPLALLIYKSRFLPKLVGVVVGIAGVSYVIDCAMPLLFPDQNLPIGFLSSGELLLPLWLLVMGVNVAKWEERQQVETRA
jgi:hypothetical protein